MAKGRVKWFNDAKGYGFIERAGEAYQSSLGNSFKFRTLSPSNTEKRSTVGHSAEYSSSDTVNEIFVHYTAILGEGRKTLAEGQEVEFDIYDGPKGRTAQNVIPKDR